MLNRFSPSLCNPVPPAVRQLVVTVTGADRSGLLGEISSAVESSLSGSILEHKMSRLCGDFAMVMKVSTPRANADVSIGDLLRSKGLDVKARWSAPPAPSKGETRKFTLRQHRDSKVTNSAALVKGVSDYLCSLGIKLEEMTSYNKNGFLEMSGVLRLPAASTLSTFDVVKGLNGLGAHVNYLDLEAGP
jgi:glycine cleavage system regulatory protein